MSDRQIPFSAPMVRALLGGRKTQTRRVLKPQPDTTSDPCGDGEWGLLNRFGYWAPATDLRPYYPGDRLWVREAWRSAGCYDDLAPSAMGGDEPVRYEADAFWQTWGWGDPLRSHGRYRHAWFMPRWASRLTLTVTDVRVQRLQDISEADAYSEGAARWGADGPAGSVHYTACEDFARIWNSLHGPDAWAANPWVAALTFTVHRCNIDQMPGGTDG
jgi:hypothetical protein